MEATRAEKSSKDWVTVTPLELDVVVTLAKLPDAPLLEVAETETLEEPPWELALIEPLAEEPLLEALTCTESARELPRLTLSSNAERKAIFFIRSSCRADGGEHPGSRDPFSRPLLETLH